MLLDTIIGGGIALAGVALVGLLDAWRERRSHDRALRLAARLVHDELGWARAGLALAAQRASWGGYAPSPDLDPVWSECKAALADGLDLERWREVRDAVRMLQQVVTVARKQEWDRPAAERTFSERSAETVAGSIQMLNMAIDALEPRMA